MNSQSVNAESAKSLERSYVNGIFSSATNGLTQEYFTPFVLLLGATTQQVGFLNALPNLFSSLVQFKSADLADKLSSRKKTIGIFISLQTFVLLTMFLMALFNVANPWTVILCVIFFSTCGSLANPAWGSLLSDLVHQNKRGEYFGWRSRNLGLVIVAFTFLAGMILHGMEKINTLYGFVIIFALAFLCRLLSLNYLRGMYEPPLEYNQENHFTFFDFIRRLKESNFAKFVIFVSLMNFSVHLAAPYFAVFMLKDLSFSYLLYSVINIMAALTVYLSIRRWGKHADRVGNLKIIKVTAPLIGIIPLFWIINRNPLFLLIVQAFAGFVWAGFNLCCTNFIYDAARPEKRARCIAYFNLLNGLAICLGALLGGFLVKYLPVFLGYKILTLFFLSSVLRVSAALFFSKMLKEVRPIEAISGHKLFFSMVGMNPIGGTLKKNVR
ncbi:MAG TPA: hypothetical protein DD723_00475 [Candidatus Omnitrophica bacterium]|nr:MAG: hypothetical protein A2Z81_09630 [Omnitrophica WOR_2 bacterium GWA2_45_18]HBR14006.1 hypothetical protein [Candidatus Omnitrophota bacterium]